MRAGMHSDSPQGSTFKQAFSPAQHANQKVLRQQTKKTKKATTKNNQQQKEIKYKKEVLKQQAEKDKKRSSCQEKAAAEGEGHEDLPDCIGEVQEVKEVQEACEAGCIAARQALQNEKGIP